MKKKVFIIVSVVVFLIGALIIKNLFFYERVIVPHYIGKIELTHKVEADIYPPMRQKKKENMLQFLEDMYAKGELSEHTYQELVQSIKEVSDEHYLMISYTKPVKFIWYSSEAGAYGWNGEYGDPKENEIYIYWMNECYGYPLDGYI